VRKGDRGGERKENYQNGWPTRTIIYHILLSQLTRVPGLSREKERSRTGGDITEKRASPTTGESTGSEGLPVPVEYFVKGVKSGGKACCDEREPDQKL